jgi:hypothetical protein
VHPSGRKTSGHWKGSSANNKFFTGIVPGKDNSLIMRTNRRNFITVTAFAGSATALLPLSSCDSDRGSEHTYTDYSILDNIRKQPV